MSARDDLARYLALHHDDHPSRLPMAQTARRVLPPAGRLWGKQAATRSMAPLTRRRAASMNQRSLKLHLGCGGNNLDGWINVDLVGGAADLVWDLRRPLPFADGAADAVFLEHVFEHMSYADVITVLGHVHRCLAPHGVVRVGVPDAGLYARLYTQDRSHLEALRAGRPTPLLALREVFQEHGHLSAYDAETLVFIMRAAGFADATAVDANTSSLWTEVPDSPDRVAESVYAEARKDATTPVG